MIGRSDGEQTMDCYVGLDASLKKTSICVVDGTGKVLCEGRGTIPLVRIMRWRSKRAISAQVQWTVRVTGEGS
jgi:hypothetical protein